MEILIAPPPPLPTVQTASDDGLRVILYSRASAYLVEKTGLARPYLWTFLVFGAPVWLLYHYYLATRPVAPERDLVYHASTYLAALCVWVGPLLNQRWESSFVSFYHELERRAHREGWSMAPVEMVRQRFDRMLPWVPLLFSLLLVVGAAQSLPLMQRYADFGGWEDSARWIVVLVAAAIGYTGGTGLWGVAKTVAIVGVLARTPLRWYPYHEDELGGLRFISDFSLLTTLLFSAGCLAIPFAVELAYLVVGPARVFVGAGTVLFSVGVAASFLAPTVQISRLARCRKVALLAQIRASIDHSFRTVARDEAEYQAPAPDTSEDREMLLREHGLMEARVRLFDHVKNAVVYPFGLFTLAKLLLSMAVPLLLFMAEYLARQLFSL